MSMIVSVNLAEEHVWQWLDRQLAELEAAPVAKPSSRPLTLEERAAQVYAKMTSYRFCKQRPAEPADMSDVILSAMRRNEPILCILGHGPLKNPNNCPHPTADWAEFFAYTQLMRLAKAVRELYEPGLSVTLYLDDGRSEYANGVPEHLTRTYRESVCRLVEGTPFRQVIHNVVSMKGLYDTFGWANHLADAEQTVCQWENDPANAEALGLMREHALKNLPELDVLPEEWATFMVQRAQDAAHRYMVGYETEKRCGLWSQPDRLYMRYSLHPGFYQIFTLRKGSVSQPWQGSGGLHWLGEGKLETIKLDPMILTRGKQTRLEVMTTVDTSSKLPMLPPLNVYRELALHNQPVAPGVVAPAM